jgi:hypothetical protein
VLEGAPQAVSHSGNTVGAPQLVADHGAFSVAWKDTRSGNDDVRFEALDAAAKPAGDELPVTEDETGSTAPSLVVTDAGYAAAWLDGASDSTGTVKFRRFCAQ